MNKELLKNVGLAVVGTLLLILVGFGSYMIANQVYPAPSVDTIQNVNDSNDSSDNVDIETVKKLTPKSIVFKQEGNDIVISWTTPLPTKANVVYITPDKTEKLSQVLKDYFNGVSVAGIFKEESLVKESTEHHISISKELFDNKGYKYFYIIETYKERRVPFGSKMDYKQQGPLEPYEIILK